MSKRIVINIGSHGKKRSGGGGGGHSSKSSSSGGTKKNVWWIWLLSIVTAMMIGGAIVWMVLSLGCKVSSSVSKTKALEFGEPGKTTMNVGYTSGERISIPVYNKKDDDQFTYRLTGQDYVDHLEEPFLVANPHDNILINVGIGIPVGVWNFDLRIFSSLTNKNYIVPFDITIKNVEFDNPIIPQDLYEEQYSGAIIKVPVLYRGTNPLYDASNPIHLTDQDSTDPDHIINKLQHPRLVTGSNEYIEITLLPGIEPGIYHLELNIPYLNPDPAIPFNFEIKHTPVTYGQIWYPLLYEGYTSTETIAINVKDLKTQSLNYAAITANDGNPFAAKLTNPTYNPSDSDNENGEIELTVNTGIPEGIYGFDFPVTSIPDNICTVIKLTLTVGAMRISFGSPTQSSTLINGYNITTAKIIIPVIALGANTFTNMVITALNASDDANVSKLTPVLNTNPTQVEIGIDTGISGDNTTHSFKLRCFSSLQGQLPDVDFSIYITPAINFPSNPSVPTGMFVGYGIGKNVTVAVSNKGTYQFSDWTKTATGGDAFTTTWLNKIILPTGTPTTSPFTIGIDTGIPAGQLKVTISWKTSNTSVATQTWTKSFTLSIGDNLTFGTITNPSSMTEGYGSGNKFTIAITGLHTGDTLSYNYNNNNFDYASYLTGSLVGTTAIQIAIATGIPAGNYAIILTITTAQEGQKPDITLQLEIKQKISFGTPVVPTNLIDGYTAGGNVTVPIDNIDTNTFSGWAITCTSNSAYNSKLATPTVANSTITIGINTGLPTGTHNFRVDFVTSINNVSQSITFSITIIARIVCTGTNSPAQEVDYIKPYNITWTVSNLVGTISYAFSGTYASYLSVTSANTSASAVANVNTGIPAGTHTITVTPTSSTQGTLTAFNITITVTGWQNWVKQTSGTTTNFAAITSIGTNNGATATFNISTSSSNYQWANNTVSAIHIQIPFAPDNSLMAQVNNLKWVYMQTIWLDFTTTATTYNTSYPFLREAFRSNSTLVTANIVCPKALTQAVEFMHLTFYSTTPLTTVNILMPTGNCAAGTSSLDTTFGNCSNLTNVYFSKNLVGYLSTPDLIGYSMFENCTKITQAPLGPISPNGRWNVGNRAYKFMYHNCTSMTSLRSDFTFSHTATTTIKYEFACAMFQGCTKLKTIPANFTIPDGNDSTGANMDSSNVFSYMFDGCSVLTLGTTTASRLVCPGYLWGNTGIGAGLYMFGGTCPIKGQGGYTDSSGSLIYGVTYVPITRG